MKKIILILFLFSILFLAGCGSDNTYTTPVQDNPIINQPENNPQEEIPEPVNLQLKEFTVEGDDLGLYPSTLTVNKGDIVKITFKVRNEFRMLNKDMWLGTIDLDSSYPTGGEPLGGISATGRKVHFAQANGRGYNFAFDYANQKLLVFQGDNDNAADAPGIEVPNATNLSTVTAIELMAILE